MILRLPKSAEKKKTSRERTPQKTNGCFLSVRIQICPKKGITHDYPYIPILFGWDWNPQSYSREGSGFLGFVENE